MVLCSLVEDRLGFLYSQVGVKAVDAKVKCVCVCLLGSPSCKIKAHNENASREASKSRLIKSQRRMDLFA